MVYFCIRRVVWERGVELEGSMSYDGVVGYGLNTDGVFYVVLRIIFVQVIYL